MIIQKGVVSLKIQLNTMKNLIIRVLDLGLKLLMIGFLIIRVEKINPINTKERS